MPTPLIVSEVFKSFTMHLRDGIELPVVRDVNFSVCSGECVVLGGPSGIGKSSILKMLYGNYAIDSGQILIRHEGEVVDIGSASLARSSTFAIAPSVMSANSCARYPESPP